MSTEQAKSSTPGPAFCLEEAERGVLAVSGSERSSWLNGVVTCDVGEARPGNAVFGLLLSKQGKIQTDFWLLAEGERLFLLVASKTTATVGGELERMLVMEDAELEDRSADLACVTLVGRGGAALAQALDGRVAWGEVRRSGFEGAVVLLPRPRLEEAVRALRAGGARLVERAEWALLLLGGGVGTFGVDYGPLDNPHEAGLERSAVSWSKGCYLGQEVVFMQDARGKLKRRLVPLTVEGGQPAPGAVLQTPAGETVGELTSVATAGSGSVALARVRAPHFEPGTRLVAAGFPAEVRGGPV